MIWEQISIFTINMEHTFPNFNIYSTPLFLLLLQGILFSFLILSKYYQNRSIQYLLLAAFLLLFCIERIHYTVGFMSLYDAYQNTKINYFLFPMTLAFGPLIYFYLLSVINKNFQISRNFIWHFIPFLTYVSYRIFIFIYDSFQIGFHETQNGVLMSNLEIRIINPLIFIVSSFHFIIYLAFTFQLYYFYRRKIIDYYSNAYQLELNWIRNFLIVYSFLFVYSIFQDVVDSLIFELHWTQKWWYHFLSSGAILYFGIKGYFTKTHKFLDLNFSITPGIPNNEFKSKEVISEEKEKLVKFMDTEAPYLNPELNLSVLSNMLKMNKTQLSEIINSGFKVNFNDFINQYRVNLFIESLKSGKHKELSLVGMAYNCGFNSKATFNRVFKKLTGKSPSDYAKMVTSPSNE